MADVLIVIGKLHDLILWITPLTEKFPRSLRHSLADRLQNELLDILRLLIRARYARDRRSTLDQANLSLEYVRHLIRLGVDLKAISLGQYEHAARLVNEVGRMVGGWRKSQSPPPLPPPAPAPVPGAQPPAPGEAPETV